MRPVAPTDVFKLISLPEESAARPEATARLRFGVAQAIAQRRIAFHYQPVVRAAAPGFAAFYECLARIRMPDGTVAPAGAFMAGIEASPLGRIVDRLALQHALNALAADPGLRLSINLSPRSMGDEEWLARLAAAPRGACDRLILEITEDAAIRDAELTLDFMAHVRGRGCAFALDDFGAGATGFKYFRDFRFDMVKIDGAFVRGVHAARDAQVLVECLRAVATHFEMLTVAEHVDDEADAAWLRRLGIDCLQGYLYGRPGAEPALAAAPEAARLAG